MPSKSFKKKILNTTASLEVDLFGGAITSFRLSQIPINPLSFKFWKQDMPVNNKGAPYQGHSLCLGHWGRPSKGEIRAGVPDRGQTANILWESREKSNQIRLEMHVTSALDGLHLKRNIELSSRQPAYLVNEVITNINSRGRFYNMVQHPTLAKPF